MDLKRGALMAAGALLLVAIVGISAFALFRNMVWDSWFTALRPTVYDGVEVTPVKEFTHGKDTLTILERPETKRQPDRSTTILRHLEVEFNGERLEKGLLPIVPSARAQLTIHYLVKPPEDEVPVTPATPGDPALDGYMPRRPTTASEDRTMLYADPEKFSEQEFQHLVTCWEENAAAINNTIAKSQFTSSSKNQLVEFETRLVHGLVHGKVPQAMEYRSEMPARYYEGSNELLVMHPDGRWNIVSQSGPVRAPLESGTVQIRQGRPHMWITERPSQALDATGVELGAHLNSFYSAEGKPLASTYTINPYELIKPTPEEELKIQAEKLGIQIVPPSAGAAGAGTPAAGAAAEPAAPPTGIPSLRGYDPTDPAFQSDDPTGLPPESARRRQILEGENPF